VRWALICASRPRREHLHRLLARIEHLVELDAGRHQLQPVAHARQQAVERVERAARVACVAVRVARRQPLGVERQADRALEAHAVAQVHGQAGAPAELAAQIAAREQRAALRLDADTHLAGAGQDDAVGACGGAGEGDGEQ